MSRISDLIARARKGEVAPTARLLSIVENDEPEAAEVVRSTHGDTGHAKVIGITGPPGAGKSSLVAALLAGFRASYDRVAVVAVDPSSPFTGGAILGDRVRMRERFLDEGVYIRSMANRGNSGGLARATNRVVNILDALGFDIILVETVGVGQEEVEVVRIVDTVCLVTIPGAGDDIQAIKSGIIEIADILVVNKADRPGADRAVKDFAQMMTLGTPRLAWRIPIVKTSATENSGIDELIAAIEEHGVWAAESGDADRRDLEAIRNEVEALLRDRVLRQLAERTGNGRLDATVAKVAARRLDPYGAVDELLGSDPLVAADPAAPTDEGVDGRKGNAAA
ncbi:methylmalonyl Co-A mutase-associated GTPase MeaB [Sphingosinicella rhizophila]|uniref:Methylmalonyl Co-A mutase-associated GTPase MeaB n=1 Tax=Sphingosinicella rhizophila TaxID=3050082 RepID=A0ABU3Q619_9SPHN|nr:methylmalonyl Co-A mutase-associated GTPase MeaB [Sphingosinicella sp. GR2756]MDT9598850.1 methylmalonyl Co-A mutase-associated GTPase MeaB [Sphingosinicella sp. GR2756]